MSGTATLITVASASVRKMPGARARTTSQGWMVLPFMRRVYMRGSIRDMQVRDVIAAVDRLAPFALAEPWDHVGLQVGARGRRAAVRRGGRRGRGAGRPRRARGGRRRARRGPPPRRAGRRQPPPADLRPARAALGRHARRPARAARGARGRRRHRRAHEPRQGPRRDGRRHRRAARPGGRRAAGAGGGRRAQARRLRAGGRRRPRAQGAVRGRRRRDRRVRALLVVGRRPGHVLRPRGHGPRGRDVPAATRR